MRAGAAREEEGARGGERRARAGLARPPLSPPPPHARRRRAWRRCEVGARRVSAMAEGRAEVCGGRGTERMTRCVDLPIGPHTVRHRGHAPRHGGGATAGARGARGARRGNGAVHRGRANASCAAHDARHPPRAPRATAARGTACAERSRRVRRDAVGDAVRRRLEETTHLVTQPSTRTSSGRPPSASEWCLQRGPARPKWAAGEEEARRKWGCDGPPQLHPHLVYLRQRAHVLAVRQQRRGARWREGADGELYCT